PGRGAGLSRATAAARLRAAARSRLPSTAPRDAPCEAAAGDWRRGTAEPVPTRSEAAARRLRWPETVLPGRHDLACQRFLHAAAARQERPLPYRRMGRPQLRCRARILRRDPGFMVAFAQVRHDRFATDDCPVFRHAGRIGTRAPCLDQARYPALACIRSDQRRTQSTRTYIPPGHASLDMWCVREP